MEPKELLQRLMDERGLNPNSLAAATKHKTTQPQVYRFLNGLVKEPKRSTWEPVAQLFRVPVEAFFDPAAAERAWAERLNAPTGWTPSQHPPEGVIVRPVAQDLIHPQSEDDLPQHTWEFILSVPASDLPKRFRAAMPDDALAPDTPRGLVLHFSTEAGPVIGHGVLVQDAAGGRHVRRYAQGLGGAWRAEARNTAYMTLHSGDGVQLLAVATGRDSGAV